MEPSGEREPFGASGDPTRMVNQPALRTSTGLIWLIIGAIFAACSLVPFVALILAEGRRSAGVATVVAALIVLLYLAMVVVRFVRRDRVTRLRTLAALMLTMAAIALIGGLLCVLIEYGS